MRNVTNNFSEIVAERVRPAAHALPWVIALAIVPLGPQYVGLATQIVIWSLFALSIDLLMGYAGIVTLGHAAAFGVGAYTAGLVAIHVTVDPILGQLCAIAAGGLASLIFGAMILHTRGVTFLILSMVICAILYEAANQMVWLTGGDDGLQGIKIAPLFGIFKFSLLTNTAYLYSLGILFLWFVFSWRLVKSPFGRSLDGIRQNARRMRAIGTPVWRRLLTVYVVSGAMAASAGALSAQSTRYVGLSVFSLTTSGIVMVMLILGGVRTLYGAFVGTIIYMVVQDWTAKLNPYAWEMVLGALLICTVLFLEGGLFGLSKVFRRRVKLGEHTEDRRSPVEPEEKRVSA